jgi:hypothetical protein
MLHRSDYKILIKYWGINVANPTVPLGSTLGTNRIIPVIGLGGAILQGGDRTETPTQPVPPDQSTKPTPSPDVSYATVDVRQYAGYTQSISLCYSPGLIP